MVCGLDSDGDGYPDTDLKCDDQYCEKVCTYVHHYNVLMYSCNAYVFLKDACPEAYSVASDGTQVTSVCEEGHGLAIMFECMCAFIKCDPA